MSASNELRLYDISEENESPRIRYIEGKVISPWKLDSVCLLRTLNGSFPTPSFSGQQ